MVRRYRAPQVRMRSILRSATSVTLGTMLAACIQPPTADGGDASVDRAPPTPDLVATDSTPADAARPEVGPDIVVMEVGTRPDAQQAFDVALDVTADTSVDTALDATAEYLSSSMRCAVGSVTTRSPAGRSRRPCFSAATGDLLAV